jgi:metal-responsive CopG/Arc/MetJ family transcriptional regulator
MTPVILIIMKTAISLPDELFSAADSLADRLGVSRSELYATALAEFVAKHSEDEITARLDHLYSSEPSTLDAPLRRAQRRSLGTGDW